MAGKMNRRKAARLKRKRRVRRKIGGTGERPRLTVFRSTKHIYAQIIDDDKGVTLASASTLNKGYEPDPESKGKVAIARQIGKLVAQDALDKGIKRVIFDRNGYIYHGRVKALADSARECGLIF